MAALYKSNQEETTIISYGSVKMLADNPLEITQSAAVLGEQLCESMYLF
jgi:hypothetical protein